MEESGLFKTAEEFAKELGVSEGTVQGWIDRGQIPTVKIGKRRLINKYQIAKNLNEGEAINNNPLVHF